MGRSTERYIRAKGQWVKITRDANKRTFTLARGYQGDFTAHDVQTYSFASLPTWADAEAMARICIDTYA